MKSSYQPSPSTDPAVETFIAAIKKDILDPKNSRKANDNLSKKERKAIYNLKNLYSNIITTQDKGGNFAVMNTSDYEAKMTAQLSNPLHCSRLDSDPSKNHSVIVEQWASKWLDKSEIDDRTARWLVNKGPKPGKAFGTVKTHKPGNPIRLITSGCGTAIENFSALTDYYIKSLAQKAPSYIKDTTDFINKLELATSKGPLPEGTLLVSWDVAAMLPNIDNTLGLKAIEEALNSRNKQSPCTESLVEAVKIQWC